MMRDDEKHTPAHPVAKRERLFDRRRLTGGVTLPLYFILFALYLLTYLGVPTYSDERIQFDIAQSFARRGEITRTLGHDQQTTVQPGNPWEASTQEPMMSFFTAPFVALGRVLPAVGMAHLAWLTNIVVTPLIACSFYLLARRLGYGLAVALTGALLLGAATPLWTYSRLLFREPLMALFTLWAFGLALLLRTEGLSRGRVLGFGLALSGMFLTKVATILTLPGLLILLLPSPATFRAHRRWFLLGAALLVVVTIGGVLLSLSPLTDGTRYSWDRWAFYVTAAEWDSAFESLLGYQVSPARSLWLYAPVLLLAFPGGWMLWRRGAWRFVLAALVTVIVFSVGYGLIQHTVWWGGWSWGPRYFVPLLPVLLLLALPVLAHVRRYRLWAGVVGGLALLSVGMQLLGMAVPTPNYYSEQVALGNTNLFGRGWDWQAANWQWAQSPVPYHLENFDLDALNIAWAAVDAPLVAGLALLGALVALLVTARRRWWSLLPATLVIAALLVGVRALHDDPRYVAGYEDFTALVESIDDAITHGDDHAVLVERGIYLDSDRVFMNRLTTPDLVAILPDAPGEDYGQGAQVITDNLVEQLGRVNARTLNWTFLAYKHTWLVTTSSPFDPGKQRPIEQIYVQYAYPIEEISTSDRARAIHALTTSVPPDENTPPNITVNATFGEALTLEGYDLPAGTTYAAGDVVPVSLAWLPVAPLDFDYHVNLYIAGVDGVPVVQRSGGPQASFGAMTAWPVDQRQRDNHGLQLPAELAPGAYTLNLVVYNWESGERLPIDADSVITLGVLQVR